MEQLTVGKWVQWNRLPWFGHVCRMGDSRLLKQFPWAERPVGWRWPNAPRKQWKDQVAADLTTHFSRRLYLDPLMAAASMTTERGVWWGYGTHHRHQPTPWPIKRACTFRCLEHHWISADTIWSDLYWGGTDLHFIVPQPDISLDCQTMYVGLVHRLFMSQLSLVLIVLADGGMARLSWSIWRWFTHLPVVTHLRLAVVVVLVVRTFKARLKIS